MPTPRVLATLALLTAFGPRWELKEQRELWESMGVTDYTYELTYHCFCVTTTTVPVLVTVVDGEVVSAVYAESFGDISEGDPVPDDYEARTIDELFDLAREALREADAVEITYDATWGFPSVIDIDYIQDAIDDELTVFARDFVAG